MGTRSLTIFNSNYSDEEIVVMYRQYDGYPTGHGKELLEFLKGMTIVNGISAKKNPDKFANGMDCLAAQVVKHFKKDAGGFYLHRAGTRDVGEEFIYTIYQDKDTKGVMIKVQDTYDGEDNVIFDGNIEKYELWINDEQKSLSSYPNQIGTESSVSNSLKNILGNNSNRSSVNQKEDGFTD
jgi:hypothetical protein